jgi:two-component system sensor histidine kinase ResE
MSSPQPPAGPFQRFHQLGHAAEQVFSRLYRTLGQPARPSPLALAQEQAERQEKRNRQLRRLLRNSQLEVERLHAILSAISDGIIMQDPEGRIVYMNDAAYRLLGSERNFWTSELGQLFNAYRDIPSSAELAPLTEPRKINLGSRVLTAQLAAVADSQQVRIGTLMMLRDVTQSEISERLRNSLITHISHELRTPLAPLRLASEVLLSSEASQPPNRRMLEMIGRNVDVLDRMVNEMIDLAALASGAFRPQRELLALDELLSDLYQEFSPDAQEARLEFQLLLVDYDRLRVLGDEKALRWAISGLLRNAMQYTEADGRVSLRCRLDERGARPLVVVEVRDNGVGIHPDDLPKIFDLFYRGTARSASGKRIDPRGLGQGLFVARTIAHAHDGALSVQSTLHQGSSFTLYLPAHQSSALPA